MSEIGAEEIPEGALASSQAKPVDLELLKEEIRKSRQTLIDSLNSVNKNLPQKPNTYTTAHQTPEKNQPLPLPLTVKKQQQRVLFQTTTATPPRKEIINTSLRRTNNIERREVFYEEIPQPRTFSPIQLPAQSAIAAGTRRNKNISQSTILLSANRNSLTPTKVTFCYQSKPADAVAYINHKEEVLSETGRKNQMLKESFIKELVIRKPRPEHYKTNNSVVKAPIPVFLNNPSPPPLERVDSDIIITEGQSLVDPINASPGKQSTNRYLSTQKKDQYRNSYEGPGVRKSRRQIFGHNFLNEVGNRNNVAQSQLVKVDQSLDFRPSWESKTLTTPMDLLQESKHTRRKIFPEKKFKKSDLLIKIEDNERKPGHISSVIPVRSVSYTQEPPKGQPGTQIIQRHSHLRSSSPLTVKQRNFTFSPSFQNTVSTAPAPMHKDKIAQNTVPRAQKIVTVSHPEPLPYFTTTISPIKTHIIPNPASPIIVERPTTPRRNDNIPTLIKEVDRSRMTIKKELTVGQRNSVKIPNFQGMEMSVEVRSWFTDHRREIQYQAERICSYDLIKRYMSEPEISVRLHRLLQTQVDPKRWLLTMVDEVYGKLKERYMPMSK